MNEELRFVGVLSDTHEDKMKALPHVINQFKKRGVQLIIHCGDLYPKHLNADLFGGLPVVCALIDEQIEKDGREKEEFRIPPIDWTFTKPGERIYKLTEYESIYVGHKLSFNFLAGSGAELNRKLQEIRKNSDGVRWIFGGHTHNQIYKQDHLISFVNPGAVQDSCDGYEFAFIDLENSEIVFSRIPKTSPIKETFSIGVISDSWLISEMDPGFWKKLAEEFKRRGVTHIIHCGGIATADIGRPEFEGFKVRYNLNKNQKNERTFENWELIPSEEPIVEINDYRFYVQYDLGMDLLEKSEIDMHMLCLNLRRKFPGISFVLCGFTNDAFLEEGQEVRIINPGDILTDRNFAVICLPRTEITFGHVPLDPLPDIELE